MGQTKEDKRQVAESHYMARESLDIVFLETIRFTFKDFGQTDWSLGNHAGRMVHKIDLRSALQKNLWSEG